MNDDIVKPKPESTQPKAVDGIMPAPPKTNQEEQASPQPTSEGQTPTETAEVPQETQKSEKPKKKIGKKLPIILAVLTLITLAGLAVYMGLSANKSDKNETGQPGIYTQTVESTVEQDKQQTSEIVNDINNLQDDTDTSGDGLTDQNLGL